MKNPLLNRAGIIVGCVLIMVWCLLPVAWIISLSFKSDEPVSPDAVQAAVREAGYALA